MRRLFTALMILTLIVLFSSTYLNSRKTEAAFHQQIDQFNRSWPGQPKIELLEYQRGLLVSELKTRVILPRNSFDLNHQVRHFPWMARVTTSLAADSSFAAEPATQQFQEQVQLQTDVTWDGASQSRLSLPALSLPKLQFQGLRFSCDLDATLQNGQIGLFLDGMTVSATDGTELQLEKIDLESYFKTQQQLPLSSSELKVAKLVLRHNNRNEIHATDIMQRSSNSLNNDKLTSSLDFQVVELQLGGEIFSAGQLQLQLDGIAVATIHEVIKQMQLLQAELSGRQGDPALLRYQLLALYGRLLQDGVSLSLAQLAVTADQGRIEGNGQVELSPSGPDSLGSLREHLSGHFALDIDQSFFVTGYRALNRLRSSGSSINAAVLNEEAEQLAGGLVQKGILARRDGGYQLQLSYQRGQGLLNGEPFRSTD